MSKVDQNISALTAAIDDIRHKVVEEPWFGQSTTDNIELPANDDQTHNESFENFYGITPENDTQQIESSQEQTQQHEQDV